MSSNQPGKDASEQGPTQLHGGYELEAGLLARVREWTDLFPWIRLARTLRLAASPTFLLLTALTLVVWTTGQRWILGAASDATLNQLGNLLISVPWWAVVAAFVWTILVWSPAAILLARQGGLLTAGRTMVGLKTGLSFAVRRSPAGWLAAVVPFACAFAIGLLIWMIGLLARPVEGLIWLEMTLALAAALVAIPCGLLCFGALLAVPLSWAALANEQDPDSLDSLSRGYEALFRRPLRLALYLVVAAAMALVVTALAIGISRGATWVAITMLALSGCAGTVPEITRGMLAQLPPVVMTTLVWGLVGGIYLLLRYDTGGQEVEDIWQPEPPPTPPLPTVGR